MPPPPDEPLLVLLSLSLLEELSLLLLEPLLPLLLLSLPLLLLLVPLELLVSEEEPGARHTHTHHKGPSAGCGGMQANASAGTPTGEKLGGGWRSSLGRRTASRRTPDDVSEDEESESELELLLLACLCFFLRAFLRASASAFFFSSSSLGV